MGNTLCAGQLPKHEQVTALQDCITSNQTYKMFRGVTNRYTQLSLFNSDRNNYIFLLSIDSHQDIQVQLPVLNQVVHTALHNNYKLTISKNIIIDPFDPTYQNTYLNVKNQLSGVEYSMRVLAFKGYNSQTFKKGLEQIWIHRHFLKKDSSFLTLADAYVYGINPDQQALVLLFEKAETSMLHLGQYRQQAKWKWSIQQKLKIIYDVLTSCAKLQKLMLFHGDIRPSNLFFLKNEGKFVLGNFSSCRYHLNAVDDDLLTVYGVQFLAKHKLKDLIAKKQNMGLLNISEIIYDNLLLIVKYLQALNVSNHSPQFEDDYMRKVANQLIKMEPLDQIINGIQLERETFLIAKNTVQQFQDVQISRIITRLLREKYKKLVEEYQFQTYQTLGYQKQFSDFAHKQIQKNNLNGQPLKNAFILKNLANFYERNGINGTEYYLNACILFCKKTEASLQFQQIPKAQQYIKQAQDLYRIVAAESQFVLNYIQIQRLRSLIFIETGEIERARNIITEVMTKASDKNLSIEKQMTLFLTLGKVYKGCDQIKLAEDKFRNGLSICQNSGAFETPKTCALFKSHFLYQLGLLQFQAIQLQHNPNRPLHEQTYINKKQLISQMLSNLTLSLNLRERQSSNYYLIYQCLQTIVRYYIMIDNFVQAKKYCTKRQNQLTLLKQIAPPRAIAQGHYDMGSICYRLTEYRQAIQSYSKAIAILENQKIQDYWKYCIKGNLALALLYSGDNSKGKSMLKQAKQIIQRERGQQHYDYIFLVRQQKKYNQQLSL